MTNPPLDRLLNRGTSNKDAQDQGKMHILWASILLVVAVSSLGPHGAADSELGSKRHQQSSGTVRATLPVGATKNNPHDRLVYIWIPAGTFTMGCSPDDNECFADEKPPHDVTISKGFWIGQTLVTQVAYKRVMSANPSRFKGEQLPVEMVSWADAQRYCQHVGMRLPTEAEWEYAARAGSTTSRYGDLEAIAWYASNSGPERIDGTELYQRDPKNYEDNLISKGNRTHAVAEKQPNAWKLYDMLGNVWEWTADWFEKTYYAASDARDPAGPPSGTDRVLRGGAWDDNARNTRLSNRYSLPPDSRKFYVSFRCVGD